MKQLSKIRVVIFTILTTLSIFSQFAFGKSTFSQEKLRNACTQYIYNKIGSDAQVSLPKIISPQEFTENDVQADIVTNIDNLQGNTSLKFEFRKDGTLLRYIEIPVRIKLFREVVIANQSVASGETLNDQNLTIEKREVTNLREDKFYSKNSLKGMRAKRNIPKGNIITTSFVDNGNYIKRGDKVTLIVKSGTVSIKTSGVALQDAKQGEDLRVKREGYQGVFQGKVGSDGSILITLK
jgi:flagella basal body P-ring formation protein FlgA